MAKFDFRNLVPGKRYKIIVRANTVVGPLTAFPSIDFIVPEAPPRARNYSLTANTVIKSKILKKNRKLKIYKYKIENPTGNKAIVVISTSPLSAKKKNKIKPGDKVTVSATGNPLGINISEAKTLSRKNKNRIRYYHSTPSTAATTGPEWRTYTADDSTTDKSDYPITHLNGKTVTIKKAKYVRLRIPKPILQNLTWNDEVKDFVIVVYQKGKKRSRLGKRRYFWDTDANKLFVLPSMPPKLVEGGVESSDENDPNVSLNVSDFPDGHPATFIKEITDEKFYQFQFIVARYIKTYDESTEKYTWRGYWIERNTPFLKKLSRPKSWRSK